MPFGASGKAFVDELATLIKGFADGTTIRKIAWKAVCVACHVLLQRPNETGSSSAYAQHLNRRMSLWKSGCVLDLLHESISIQEHLPQWSKRKTRSQSEERENERKRERKKEREREKESKREREKRRKRERDTEKKKE